MASSRRTWLNQNARCCLRLLKSPQKKWPPPAQVIQGFETLRAALIDASSVIYTLKAGFFEILLKSLSLYSPVEIIRELGDDAAAIAPAACPAAEGSNDKALVQCAAMLALPIISEDKGIITAARKADIPAYNAIMMLNFLLWKRRLATEEFTLFRKRLKSIVWYAPEIWEYAGTVHAEIASSIRD